MAVKKQVKKDKIVKPSKSNRAKAVVKPVSRVKKGVKIAVFIDLDNTNASRDNLAEVFSLIERKGDIAYGKLYGYSDDKVREFEEIVAEYRLETAGRSRIKTDAASIIDTRLVVDCLVFAEEHEVDNVFVWTGMGDLIPVFTRLIHLGCSTMTVDLPDFDCNNKFVDEKLKLFSPHTSIGATRASAPSTSAAVASAPVAAESAVKTPPVAAVSAFGSGRVIPQLPRKKGAPDFGAPTSTPASAPAQIHEKKEEDSNEDDTEDVYVKDDFSNEDFDLDDEVDEEEEDEFKDSGKDVFNAEENEKMLAMTDKLLRDLKNGKFMEADEIQELDKLTAKKTGTEGVGGAMLISEKLSTIESDPVPVTEKKESKDSYDANKYDVEEDVKIEEKAFEKDDFSDFGDL